MFFFGRFLVLSLLLILVSSSIRGRGGAVLGKVYYYLVMPGVVCHETAHAAACFCTGMKVVEFEPFKPHGDTLGYVKWDPGKISLWTFAAAFFIGTAPLWIGCAVVWGICRILIKTGFLQDTCPSVILVPPSGFFYWKRVASASFSMMKTLFKNWKFKSIVNIFITYLLFCIISEMPPSFPDLQAAFPGIILFIVIFFILNIIPFIGEKIDNLTIRLKSVFFTVHSVIVFVLLLDLLFFLCIAVPFSIIF